MAAQALEHSVLEKKDKAQLTQIATALGVKTTSRTKKADIIAEILAKTGGSNGSNGDAAPSVPPASVTPAAPAAPRTAPLPPKPELPTDDGDNEPKAAWELDLDDGADKNESASTEPTSQPRLDLSTPDNTSVTAPNTDRDDTSDRGSGAGQSGPKAKQQNTGNQGGQGKNGGAGGASKDDDGDSENRDSRSKRRRRRRKSRNRSDGPQGEDQDLLDEDDEQPQSNEPVRVEGYLDMRDEGYGFLRVNNYLASKSDSYVPVKMSRRFGLRKGDHVVGTSRPAQRNEKNPALLDIQSVNGRSPEEAKKRPRFEDLTALFPDEKLQLEDPMDPANMTARIIDLVSPIGKGQRGLIVSPPKAGKTTVMKTIVSSIEKNNPETKVIVLLIDERPEEVTDMKRTVRGEVIASTFDKPSDQHTQVAEMAIEKAKRMVEYGDDVVIVLDGITRLSRAYNLAAPASGRILSGGIDAGALYPPKRFFGAARNIEEGGSLTILATALVETNSKMDEAVFEEFKGTGNMELRLDRKLAERRIYPAIDVDASSTRHEELLFDRKQLQMVWKLRRVLSGLAQDGSAGPGLELLVDRLKTFRTNDEFLTEIAKQPGM